MIQLVLQDKELRERCARLLAGSKHFDTVFREATTVFEHRVRTIAGITRKMNPADLVAKTIHPDPTKAMIVFNQDPPVQEGFYGICKGIVLAFRDPNHHRLIDDFTREDAIKFCGFVDAVLKMLAHSKVQSVTPS